MPREKTFVAREKPVCLFPRCGSDSISRGNCNRHYQCYRIGVEILKKYTWQQLEAANLTEPLQRNFHEQTIERINASLKKQTASS